MERVIDIIFGVLACADIAYFIFLLSRAIKKVSGLNDNIGVCVGIAGGSALMVIMLSLLRRDAVSEIKAHSLAASVVFMLLLIIMIVLTRAVKDDSGLLTIEQLDELDGTEFEASCAELLKQRGFEGVTLTKVIGDFGVDILAEYDGLLYGIQCKRYSSRLDSKPVQEVTAGIAYYECDVGAVMTNSDFTEHARELAEAAGIELWDRDVLIGWIKEYNRS